MTERPITPLRLRMIEDMTIRRINPHTQGNYIRAVARLAQHFNKSPELINYEEVRQYRLHQRFSLPFLCLVGMVMTCAAIALGVIRL